MTEPNQNPPSEREWTIAEREEFFASQDAITGILNGIPSQPPIEWSTGAWNGPLIELDHDDPFGDLERIFRRGIHVTKIVPPEQGWPMAFYCPLCKETTFLLSPWAVKPKDGDYFKMNETCASEEHYYQHNMQMAMRTFPVPNQIGAR
jgi:hypothetical protein